MKMRKVAHIIADFLVSKGVKHMFTVTGGGAMHLNDAFGHNENLTCIYNHHEQACSIAAEGYARLTGKIAGCCVTSGPGGTNAITGVMGGYLDSIPMFVVSGQVKRETTVWSVPELGLRQLGDQEFPIVDAVSCMTKYAVMVTDPEEIMYHLEKAWYLANNGRKGPVWLDIPLDVQAAKVEEDSLKHFEGTPEMDELIAKEAPVYDEAKTEEILKKISEARRPVILAGTAVRLAGAEKDLLEAADKLKVPVVTAWNAHDLMPDDNPYYCGRPGTVGTRGGNFVVQSSDLIFVVGCRMNIRMISYNYKAWAKDAFKIVVDIDPAELEKPTVNVDMKINADLKDVLVSINKSDYEADGRHDAWLKWCRDIDARFPACLPEYDDVKSPVNPYVFIDKMSKTLTDNESVICGNGSACVVTFQGMHIKNGTRLFTNSGCAAMGYGFPAAVGCAVAKEGERVICIDGDGSFQMNLQEMQTVIYNKMNLKTFILNNNGYHSIRQTQTNLFQPPLVGVCDGNGLSFPDLEKLSWAYGMRYVRIDDSSDIEAKVKEVLEGNDPVLCEVVLSDKQTFSPKLSSKVMPDGKIVSPPIEDMFPFLEREEFDAIKESVPQ
ncbi:MAG: thiamine pyrophosphate-binding protein [Clostridiales bacterium]|nr:thiamine pyrophosphate-binding protein [Clostridiales bacterium]